MWEISHMFCFIFFRQFSNWKLDSGLRSNESAIENNYGKKFKFLSKTDFLTFSFPGQSYQLTFILYKVQGL